MDETSGQAGNFQYFKSASGYWVVSSESVKSCYYFSTRDTMEIEDRETAKQLAEMFHMAFQFGQDVRSTELRNLLGVKG